MISPEKTLFGHIRINNRNTMCRSIWNGIQKMSGGEQWVLR